MVGLRRKDAQLRADLAALRVEIGSSHGYRVNLGDDSFIEQTLGNPALSSTDPLPSLDEIERRDCFVCGVAPTALAMSGRELSSGRADVNLGRP